MTPNIQLENIPAELRGRDQWVTWKLENGVKVPYDAKTGRKASSTNPATWASYDEACAAWRRRHHTGIGYVFAPEDPYTGIDLDDCIDDAGELAGWARSIVDGMASYAEISPSGTGVKLWVVGAVPRSLKTKSVEIYSHSRYFTVTGHRLPGAPPAIRYVNGELTALYEQYRPAPAPVPAAPLPSMPTDAEHARRYALAALEGERQKMMAAGDGERHDRRYASAYALAGFLHTSALTEDEIFDALDVNHGPNVANARKTIRDGIRAGQDYPRDIPPPRTSNIQVDLCPNPELDTLDEAELRRQLQAARAERDRWKARAERLDTWREWTLNLAAVETERLSPAAKVVAWTLWPEMESRKEHSVDEPRRIHIDTAREKAGVSASTYGSKLKELENAGAIARIEARQENGYKKILVQPTAAFALPQAWGPETPRSHGGARAGAGRPTKACPKCGPDAPIKEQRQTKIHYRCAGCGLPLGDELQAPTYRTLHYCAESDTWGTKKPEANTELDPIVEDCGSPLLDQVDGWAESTPPPAARICDGEDYKVGETWRALWHGPNEDTPVTIVGDYGVGPDGRRYLRSADSASGFLADQVELLELLKSAPRPTHTAHNPDYRHSAPAPPLVIIDPLDLPGVRSGLIAPDDPWIRDQQRLAASFAEG